MNRICSTILALLLAFVTTTVPASRFPSGAAPSPAPVVLAQSNGAPSTPAPAKRCQSGSALLACLFDQVHDAADIGPRLLGGARFHAVSHGLPAAWTVPVPHGPPRAVSA
ncbi:hypothetical protein ACUN0C_02710 [Faunimonas sp. B44]|uniref:hypothetical protein n=1 Tax=Faunimonas sp. B44 TaxID=3461493 RepID=UPI004043D34A